MEFHEAKAIAERLGFQLFADVRGDTNALRLFTEDFRQKYGKKYRCGVYMQFRADGSCYIGQSLDVDRRHKRHRELGVIVDYLAFRGWPPSVLMEPVHSGRSGSGRAAREQDVEVRHPEEVRRLRSNLHAR